MRRRSGRTITAWIAIHGTHVHPLLFGLAADAAEPVFPPGSRIGLVPPVGMIVSQLFQGFEDREKNASVIFVELSSEAYPEIEKSFAVETLKAQGIDVQAREEFPLKDGHGFLVIAHLAAAGTPTRKWVLVATEHDLTAVISVQVPDAAQDTYPDAALRVSLATFTTRAAVPVQEQLDLLPFSLKDLAGFRIVRAAASGAALLTDGPKDAIELEDGAVSLLDPLLAHQTIGAVVQGLGGAPLEHLVYDADGQLLTGSLADYLMPTASDFPTIRCVMSEDYPSPINPLGAKGAGEGGIIAAGGVIANAVANALGSFGVDLRELPLTPSRVWQLIDNARRHVAAE